MEKKNNLAFSLTLHSYFYFNGFHFVGVDFLVFSRTTKLYMLTILLWFSPEKTQWMMEHIWEVEASWI